MLDSDDAIAVVGLGARVPGAGDVEELWLNLVRGRESVAASAVLSSHTTELCEPPAGLFVEVASSAIEDAGYDPAMLSHGVGVFACAGPSTPGPGDDVAATASARLDLRGPSVTVRTDGPGALVALHLACQSLRVGDCDVAVVGGAHLEPADQDGDGDGVRSSDGHCRPFDAAATGPVFAGGAVAVLVKRLSDALADGDHIRAVIRGSAVNNDGAGATGAGLTAVALESMALAGVRPEDISYVEAHAAGDPHFDAVEVAALAAAYTRLAGSPLPAGRCPIGSVKANLGDLGPVAGLAGLLKTVLALDRQLLPPSINVTEAPYPSLVLRTAEPPTWAGLAATPFRVRDQVASWPRDPRRPRLAAVSAFGAGSNVHVVLEEGPAPAYAPHAEQPRVVLWSGLTGMAERAARDRLALFFVQRGEEVFADAVAVLQHGRAAHPVRAAAVCTSALDAAGVLGAVDSARVLAPGREGRTPRPVSLLFPGQGSALAARELYDGVPAFARSVDGWLELLDGPELPVKEQWRHQIDGGAALLFVVEAALAQLWREAGVQAAVVVGDGIGMLAALTAAEVLEPGDAATLVRAWPDPREFDQLCAGVAAKPPAVPVFATATGREVTTAEVNDPAFWSTRLLAGGEVEATASTALAGRYLAISTVPQPGVEPLLTAAATLWTAGHDLAWETLGQAPLRQRVALPAYPFRPVETAPVRPLAAAVTPGRAASASSPWSLDVVTAGGDGPMVIAFPYAGASGRVFQPLRRYLPPECGLALVDLPGHGARMTQECLRDVDAVLGQLLAALPARPLLLLGYSLGGSLAYQLAGRLTDAGTPPVGLVVCGTRAPQTGVGHPPVAHRAAGDEFLRAAVDMGLAAPEMVEIPELAATCAAPLQADLFMSESFPFRAGRPPLDVPVAVVGMRADWLVPEPALRGWDDLCRRPPLQLRVDGGHLALHERQRECGEAIGRALAHVLEAGRDPARRQPPAPHDGRHSGSLPATSESSL